ncbi:hypothetical protein MLD38_012323 [Melastoma candidum]|uniref:Uncharacterized protein n=1 Tax=Melastoma candidum TaxID=119954 RepID=A0ACB9R6K2_9MYRT|nr:hypothetical protein MLD38_012323 [Melastoma candidum]
MLEDGVFDQRNCDIRTRITDARRMELPQTGLSCGHWLFAWIVDLAGFVMCIQEGLLKARSEDVFKSNVTENKLSGDDRHTSSSYTFLFVWLVDARFPSFPLGGGINEHSASHKEAFQLFKFWTL